MEGILKSAPTDAVVQPVVQRDTQPVMFNGVPLMMVEFFELDPRNLSSQEKRQLNEIYEFFRKPDSKQEDLYSAMRSIEQARGITSESRVNRMHRWIKINQQINDLRVKRDML
jgi:hypothetical protein